MNPEDWRLIIIKIKTNLLPNSWNLEVKKKCSTVKNYKKHKFVILILFIGNKQIQKFYKN